VSEKPNASIIFTVSNHHSAACGRPPYVDGDIRKRYHGYYENEVGEQILFVYDRETQEGTLWMGDAGWERAYKVRDGKVPSLNMGQNEADWLMTCWKTATAFLPKGGE